MQKERDAGLKAYEIIDPRNGKIDIEGIKKVLPHRDPFLFVDEITEVEPDKRIVGVKKITGAEYFFAGHFPGKPIMPGVLILEALAQVGGILMLNKKESLNRPAYFLGLDNVRFRKAVIPGDVLRLEVEVLRLKRRVAQLHGAAKVEGETAAETDILFSFSI